MIPAHEEMRIEKLIANGDDKGVYAAIDVARTAGDFELVRYIIKKQWDREGEKLK